MNTDSKPEPTNNPPQDNPVGVTNQAIGSSKKALTKKSKIAIGAAGVVVIAMLGLGGYSLYKNLGANASTAIEVRNGPLYGSNGFVDMAGRTSPYEYVDSNNNSADLISFSQDGSRVVYSVTDYNDSSLSNIYTASSDNKDIRLVAEKVRAYSRISISPDKKHVAYITLRVESSGQDNIDISVWGITTVNLSTGESSYIEDSSEGELDLGYGSDLMYSSDSKSVIYTTSKWRGLSVCRASLDLASSSCQAAPDTIIHEVSGQDRVSGMYRYRYIDDVKISSDGSKLAVSYSESFEDNSLSRYGMKVFDVSNNFTLVPGIAETSNYRIGSLLWSPDGSKLVYSTQYEVGSELTLSMVDASTGKAEKFLSGHDSARSGFFKAWQPIPKNGKQSPLPSSVGDSIRNFATCELIGADQTSFVGGNIINNASVKLTGNGAQRLTASKGSAVRGWGPSGGRSLVDISSMTLEPGEERILQLPSYIVEYADYMTPTYQIEIVVWNEAGTQGDIVYCGPAFILPQPTIGILGGVTKTVRYGKSIELQAVTKPGGDVRWHSSDSADAIRGYEYNEGVYVYTHTGKKDVGIYASVNNKSIKSETVSIRVTPFVDGSTTKTVGKNKTATISGSYTPNSKITLYMRNSKDKVGQYPTKKTITVNKYGKFSYKFKANKKYKSYNFYLAGSNGANTSIYTYKVK